MSVTQMMLTRAQAVDMLDRFTETSSVLVPVWRQHTLALISTKSMSPSMVAEASKAHQALMRSLSQSLEGIEH
jgi:RecA/RadA recombinase